MTATIAAPVSLADGATPTPLLTSYREQMKTIMSGADAGDGGPTLTDDARAKFDALAELHDLEVRRINDAHGTDVEKSRDLERMKSLAVLTKSDDITVRTAFETDTSELNKSAAGLEFLAALEKGRSAAPVDLGAAFVKSESYQAATRTGEVIKGANIGVDTGVMVKTLVTSPTVGSTASVRSEVQTIHRLLDAVTILPTGRDTIVSHRYTFNTNAAAVVAEGTPKPESALTVTTVTLTPSKIAHFLPITAEALADHPRMQAMINSILVNGLRNAIESKIATDLAAWSGLATTAFDTDVVTSILAGKVAAMEYGMPNGILMSTSDYQALALLKGTANDHYISPGPFGPANFTVWGLPVFPCSALADGFVYVGDLSQIVWNERTPIQLAVGWTGTQFIENEVTILCEQRGMLDVMHNLQVVKADISAV